MWKPRFAIYIAGLIGGFLAVSGYADFDPATWTLDIHPFNVKDFVLTSVSTVANGLAALAAYRGWKREK